MYLASYNSGSAEPRDVAVKLVRVTATQVDQQDFLAEAELMLGLDYPGILSVVGVCISRRPWLLVVEYMAHKDLGSVLTRIKTKGGARLRINEILHLAEQVADCMRYLAEARTNLKQIYTFKFNKLMILQKRILHCDLAVRNVLLGQGNQVKLGDFGLAKYLAADKSEFLLSGNLRIPVRSMAPESLAKNSFSLMSDVWACGVTVWEIFTCVSFMCICIVYSHCRVSRLAEVPYKAEGIKTEAVRAHITSGKRLAFPDVRHYLNIQMKMDIHVHSAGVDS